MANTDYTDYLEEAYKNQQTAYDKNFQPYMEVLNQQKSAIPAEYNTARSQAYTGSRISALGNNESLANMGLAGNAYTQPKSGYSETSRVYQDVALQNTLGKLSAEQRSAAQALQNTMSQAYAQRASDYSKMQADYYTNRQQEETNVLNMAPQYAAAGQQLPNKYKGIYEKVAGTPYETMLLDAAAVELYKANEDNRLNADSLAVYKEKYGMSDDAINKALTIAGLSNPTSTGTGIVKTYEPEALKKEMTNAGILDAYGYIAADFEVKKHIGKKILPKSIDPQEMSKIGVAAPHGGVSISLKNGKMSIDNAKDGSVVEAINDRRAFVYYNGHWYEIR